MIDHITHPGDRQPAHARTPSPLRPRSRHLLAFALLTLLIGGVYLPVVLGHASLLTNGPWPQGPLFVGDPIAGGPATIPMMRLASISWTHLVLPIIDPYQGYGIPLLANQGVPVYLPEILLHLLLPSNYSLWNLVNLVLLSLGSYLLASSFGQTWLAGIAVGVAASLVGVAPPNVNMAMLNPLAVSPFVLLSCRYLLEPTSRHNETAFLGLATSMTMLCLSGFQEVLPLLAVIIVVYAIAILIHFRTMRIAPRLIAATAASAVAGIVIGSVGILPTLSTLSQGAGLNAPTSYLSNVPSFWLSTLTIPSIIGKAMTAYPVDMGQTAWTLGTPILVVVIILAVCITIQPEGHSVRWYVWPSALFSIFGLLGYSDIFNVLRIFSRFPFDSIAMVRFLQFAWWLPWCLLLGTVIENVHFLRWYFVLGALVTGVVFDVVFLIKFQDALLAAHLSRFIASSRSAFFLALGVMCVFLLVGVVTRAPRIGAIAMVVIVVASSIYYLPTSFFPSSANDSINYLQLPYSRLNQSRYNDYGLTTIQLTTRAYSVQAFSAIISSSYMKVLPELLPEDDVRSGQNAVVGIAPTMYFANFNEHFIKILKELGTSIVTSPTELPASLLGAIGRCGAIEGLADNSSVCLMGRGVHRGGTTHMRPYVYSIVGASPLVDPITRVVEVPTSHAGIDDTLSGISAAGGNLTDSAYVTMTGRHPPAARGVVGLSRTANTQSVTISLRARTGGMVILRETYEPGMRASVDGASASVYPADGGLWTAVAVGPGRSRIVLDYATDADLIEFALAGVGLLCLLIAWCVLALTRLRRDPDGGDTLAPMDTGTKA